MSPCNAMGDQPDGRSKKSTPYIYIVNAMLERGLTGVRSMRPEPSKHSMLQAALHLRNAGRKDQSDELTRYIRRTWPARKAKTHPQVGDVRTYIVQEQDGIPYLRTPMIPLGGKRGDQCQVVFEEDKVTIRRIDAGPLKYAEARAAKIRRREKRRGRS